MNYQTSCYIVFRKYVFVSLVSLVTLHIGNVSAQGIGDDKKRAQVVPPITGISKSAPNVGYFENKVFDDKPKVLLPEKKYDSSVNDTKRLQSALDSASKEKNGGVVIMKSSKGEGNNRYRLDRIIMPSNVRLEIDPDVTIEMIGVLKTKGPKQFLFTIGRSRGNRGLSKERVKNVEIRSTHPTKRFTVDSKTNYPVKYGRKGGESKDTSVNYTRSIPVSIFYAENFSVSGMLVIDNHTESVAVQMYPDTDYRDGIFADRKVMKIFADDVYLDEKGKPLPVDENGNFIDEKGNVIPPVDAVVRNQSYARTPIKGTIQNIRVENAHTGYGAVQIYGGDWIYIKDIEAVNSVAVRLEVGNGTSTDNLNRAGPYVCSINNIEVHDVTLINGFTAVWLKPHGKINTNILVNNVTAIDSGTAVLIGKGHMAKGNHDFINGRFENLRITGDIKLIRTKENEGLALAEVGNALTFFMSPEEVATIKDTDGNGVLTQNDLSRNKSGKRWYLMQPTSPMIMENQLSATEIGDQSSDVRTKNAGHYPVDISKANIISVNPLREEKILYTKNSLTLEGAPSGR